MNNEKWYWSNGKHRIESESIIELSKSVREYKQYIELDNKYGNNNKQGIIRTVLNFFIGEKK